jgi:peptide/nickel transport system ATP-binding protein
MSGLLSVADLHVSFTTRHGTVPALRGVSLSLAAGETLGLVGESGSGKSVTALAVMRLLDRAAQVTGGRITFRGEDITQAGRGIMQPLRGAAMSMIFQNPRAALNPIRPVGLQIADVLRAHRALSAAAARDQALDLLRAVHIREPERRLGAYPHELSGGMCQRVMIAMAISCEPALLIADEPTTGLDVSTQKAVMDLLGEIIAGRGMALLLITHDLGVIAETAHRVVVMYAGRKVEEATVQDLFDHPVHPYTRGLLASRPKISAGSSWLSTIEGTVPAVGQMGTGCSFAPRCPLAGPPCAQRPPLREVGVAHQAACVRPFEGGHALKAQTQ